MNFLDPLGLRAERPGSPSRLDQLQDFNGAGGGLGGGGGGPPGGPGGGDQEERRKRRKQTELPDLPYYEPPGPPFFFPVPVATPAGPAVGVAVVPLPASFAKPSGDKGGEEEGGEERRGHKGGQKGKGSDIEQVDDVANKFDMDPETRREFGRYVEETKEGRDSTFQELVQKALEFLGRM